MGICAWKSTFDKDMSFDVNEVLSSNPLSFRFKIWKNKAPIMDRGIGNRVTFGVDVTG